MRRLKKVKDEKPKKIKFKRVDLNNPVERQQSTEIITIYLYQQLLRAFARCFAPIGKKIPKYIDLAFVELIKQANSKNKIIFKENFVFDDHKTSELIKLIIKFPLFNDLPKLYTRQYKCDEIGKLNDEMVKDQMQILRPYLLDDCDLTKEWVKDIVYINVCGYQLYNFLNVENMLTKQYKTFFTKLKKWGENFITDVKGE